MLQPATTQDIDSLRREMRNLVGDVQTQVTSQADGLTALQTNVANLPAAYNDIVNFLNNSHPEWSKAAYLATGVLASDAGDTNLEAYNWFRQLAADVALAQSSAHALKAAKTSEPADHTLWAANEAIDADIPRFDKVNGTIEMGGVTNRYDLFVPIAGDLIFPGQIFYVQFEAMLRTANPLPDIRAYGGIYDNTGGQQKYIEGGSFAITDDQGNNPGVTFGIPGATSIDYKVIAYTDSNEQAESNVLNFPNAPATFDLNNHPRIKFSGVPGFIKWEIYRRIGTTYVLQFTVGNSIDGVYADVGNPPQAVVSAFPTVTYSKPRAYAITSTFQPGSLTGLGWVRHSLTIQVPLTYNRAVTGAGMQYFRFGFDGLTTDPRQVLLRRFGLAMGSGKWARSPEDIRTNVHSSVSTSAAGAGSSGGGGIDPPPGDGGGGPDCVLLDSTLRLLSGNAILGEITQDDIRHGVTPDSGGSVCGRIKSIHQAHASRIYRVTSNLGFTVGCTREHPFITSKIDFNGTACELLRRKLEAGGMVFVLVYHEGTIVTDHILSITEESGDFWVGMPYVDGPHTVILNGFLCHNRKLIS